ncbi:DUF4291 domain-containing protein [Actinomadura scrupuli]|uniref:DUF4291 domain-containing protein n=1 Tax=Actinomadura scrupuli TaxID=559629 RepID=UPI003D97A6D8
MNVPYRQIRAAHDDSTITVYQAYGPEIGRPAAESGRFPEAFKRDRMTWIKPSFLWMMYRCGWAAKPGQEHVLAIRLDRAGFEWALRHSCLSHYDRNVHADRDAWLETRHLPVRLQWDPERDLRLQPLPYRSLQIGLSGEAVRRYLTDWIVGIDDLTAHVRTVHDLVGAGRLDEARGLLPAEAPYPLRPELAARIGSATPAETA